MIWFINIFLYVFCGWSLFLVQYVVSSLVMFCFIPIRCHGCLMTACCIVLCSAVLFLLHLCSPLRPEFCVSFSLFIFYALKRTPMSAVHSIFNSTVSFNFTNCFCSVSTFRCVMSCLGLISDCLFFNPLCFLDLFTALFLHIYMSISALYVITGK